MKNIVIGSILRIKEPKFSGNYRNAKYEGDYEYIAEVISDTYGAQNKHWFTIKVIDPLDSALEKDKKIRRQGKNLYKNSIILQEPSDIEQKTTVKKMYKELNLQGF